MVKSKKKMLHKKKSLKDNNVNAHNLHSFNRRCNHHLIYASCYKENFLLIFNDDSNAIVIFCKHIDVESVYP